MAENQAVEVEGLVLENLPQTKFKVLLIPPGTDASTFKADDISEEKQTIITGFLAGKMRKNKIRIYPGDIVKLELSAYDLTQGRITYRNK